MQRTIVCSAAVTDVVGGARFDVGIDPKSSFSWNIDFGYFVNEKFEVGGLFAQQNSQMEFFSQSGAFRTVPQNWVNNIQATVAFNTGTAALGSLTDDWLCGPYGNCEVVDKSRTWSRQFEVVTGGFFRF